MPKRTSRRISKTPTSKDELSALQAKKLRAMLAALPANPFYRRKLAGFDPKQLKSLDDLRSLPFTTKQELLDDQTQHPPYGSNLTYPLKRYTRLHQTSGTKGQPLRWLDTPESWRWLLDCWKIIFETVGLRPKDRLFFPFSFGPFLGFWAAFEGAARLGNFCLPGGGMTSAARLRFLLDNQITVVCCTPTYALRLAEVARQEKMDLAGSPVEALIVAGEPGGSIPATRKRIEEAWGARVFDHTGMTEIGPMSIECQEIPGTVHVLETEFVVEVVRNQESEVRGQGSGTRDQIEYAEPGEEGELVVTNLGRWGSPVIRYRTGDRVVVDPSPCPCGRGWLRLKGGILGRTDDMIFIRGNNVYPSSIEAILRRFPEVDEYRIVVNETGPLTSLLIELECEQETGTESPTSPLASRVQAAIRDELSFRPEVRILQPGSLPKPEMKAQRIVRKME